VDPPRELDCLAANLARPAPPCPFRLPEDAGFARAVVIPRVFALHATLASHKRRNPPRMIARLGELAAKALAHGPDSLNDKEKLLILGDPDCLRELHHKVWALDADAAARWGIL
jgi:membrane glycosyltransferase